MSDKKHLVLAELRCLLGELAGQDLGNADAGASFFDLGFDSLLLTQASALLKNRFGVKVTFRQLLEDLTSIEALADYLDAKLPTDAPWLGAAKPAAECTCAPPAGAVAAFAAACAPHHGPSATPPESVFPIAFGTALPNSAQEVKLKAEENELSLTSTVLERIMKEQLVIMAKQLDMLRAAGPQKSQIPRPDISVSADTATGTPVAPAISARSTAPDEMAADDSKSEPKAFGPYRPINTAALSGFGEAQQKAIAELVTRYTRKTPESKRLTQLNRRVFCDPRSVSGFRTFWKEMVYPIVTTRSDGARFWDVDGNEYIDVTMGFGTNLLGHSPPFITTAIEEQLKKGIEVGPQSALAGKVANLMCELTGHERAAFCNTGSEAVLAAIRVARTVTGRSRIATTGGFHGICDEVLVRANVTGGKRTTVPVAPGIPQHVAREVLVVDYGTREGLEILKQNMADLAMVLVEPVQSRHPDLQPREFLHELRQITSEQETALLFDEVITGFRCHLGGAQAHFGVKADLATWGKIIGGGMPIGALSGSARFMDALDGGCWQYGDASFPEAGVTFFAGTYVRHPLAMAASHAMLSYLKAQGPTLQERLNTRTTKFVRELNDFLRARGVPLHIEHFASLFYFHFPADIKHGALLWFYLRERGIHIWEGRPCFFSTAHTDEDIAYLTYAFKESISEMQQAGFLPAAPMGAPSLNGRMEFPCLLAARSIKWHSPPRPVAAAVPARAQVTSEPRDPQAVASPAPPKRMDFSVYLFGNYDAEYREDKYKIILEAAKFADANGFRAIWIPERHFHKVGGFSPNPSVIAAALALQTQNLQLRAGSVVLPLHHPVRVAEEWAVVDNLSGGRVGISIASGWHPNDFIFAPGAYEQRRELCWQGWDVIRRLWRGETIEFPTGGQNVLPIKLHPMPKQAELPTWLTCIHKDSYLKAGELGLGTLGYTMNTSLEELADKIAAYRDAYAKHGHDPAKANVTILLHTFVGPTADAACEIAHGPMCDYFRAFLDNSQKRLESQRGQAAVDEEDIQFLLDRAFKDYVKGKALIGSPESCAAVVEQMRKIGVNEIGCFLDFGIAPQVVLEHLSHLAKLKRRFEDQPVESLAPGGDRTVVVASSPNVPHAKSEPDQTSPGDETKADTIVALPISTLALNGEHGVPMPDAQKGLWAIAQISRDASRSYNESTTLDLRGPLNFEALRHALQRCVDRHEALRSAMNENGESQTIHARVALDVPSADVSTLAGSRQRERLDELFAEFEGAAFDLGRAPMLRALVIKLGEQHHLLALMFHHTLGNGPSYWVFLEEMTVFYEAETRGCPIAMDPPMQLSQYLHWRFEQGDSPERQQAEQFWLKEFSGNVPVLELPSDRPRPSAKTFKGGRCALRLEKSFTDRLRKTGAAHRCSLFMILFAAYRTLLHRLSGEEDLVVGVPFDSAVRALPNGKGLFVNTTNMTPLRSRVTREMTFAELLRATKDLVLECNEHQDYFFGNLLPKLKLKPDLSRPPLFSVAFNYETGKFVKEVAGLKVELITDDVPYRGPKDTSTFDLNMNIAEKDGELLLEWDYSADLFDPSTVQRWLTHLNTLLEAAVNDPQQPLWKLPLLSANERNQLVGSWNNTCRDYSLNATLHSLVSGQVALSPEAIAVECDGQRMTYVELERRSSCLANYLRARGVAAETLVAVCVERSLDMLVALLGVLKAGGAYVPVDPDFPRDRIALMLEDAATPVLITHQTLIPRLPESESQLVCLDRDWTVIAKESLVLTPPDVGPDNLAYVIYTSGSTGKPKGVEITHRAVVNFLESMRREPALSSKDAMLALTTLSFDIAGLELFLPLIVGARIVVANREVAVDPRKLVETISHSGVTAMQATPATWRLLLNAGWQGDRKLKILCGGEALSLDLAHQLLQCCGELWNMYGPTETTIWSACRQLKADEPVTIGRPITNTQIYIVDESLEAVPIGVAGELLIGGVGVARGYRNRPDLTAERFVADPFRPGSAARLYRTGDLARYRPNGEIEFLGRTDFQVKVRGYRMELGDIEAALLSHPAVREAVVVAREDAPDEKRLVAYVVAQASAPFDRKEIRNHLKSKLPEYMVPAHIVQLDGFPQTPNRKIDRKALPPPEQQRAVVAKNDPPQTPAESKLAEIWSKLLHVVDVSRTDNFFDLGGHSILAVTLFAQIEREFGRKFPLAMLFKAPTLWELAASIEATANQSANWSPLVGIQPKGALPPLIFVHGAGGNVLLYRDLARYLAGDVPFYGLQAQGLDGDSQPLARIEEMAERYLKEVQHLQPHGPYRLGGYCMGGLVAYEMAQRLHLQGKTVSLLVLLDTYNLASANEESVTSRFSLVRQKIMFHLSNLVHLTPRGMTTYLGGKIAAAKDAELNNFATRLRNLVRWTSWTPGNGRHKQSLQNVNDQAALAYRPSPYFGPLTVFRPKSNYDFYPDPELGWRALARGGLEIVELPVNPHAMLVEPYVRLLAGELNKRLEQDRQPSNTSLIEVKPAGSELLTYDFGIVNAQEANRQ